MTLQSHSWAHIWIKHDQKETCTPMFVVALVTMAKTWKRPKRPLTEDWIKTMWHIQMEYYPDIKKNEIMPFAANGWICRVSH